MWKPLWVLFHQKCLGLKIHQSVSKKRNKVSPAHPLFTDTIEKEMRRLFNIPPERETRLWNKYMSNTYEQLNKPDSTVQDAGLFQGQVVKSWTFIFYLQYLMDSLPYFS